MSFGTNDRRFPVFGMSRVTLAAAAVLLTMALGACTTEEGTNAFENPATFERSVMTSTMQGLDLIPQDEKPVTGDQRAPLVMPKQTAVLPPPTTGNSGLLPEDSSKVKLNTAGLSDADIRRLRDARVVDLRSLNGRQLTDNEQRQLIARLGAANLSAQSSAADRPLILPPPQYFTTYKGKNLICLAANGELVALNDPACPEKIRKALSRQGPNTSGVANGIDQQLNNLKYQNIDHPNEPGTFAH